MANLKWTLTVPTTGGATMVTNAAIKTLLQFLAPTNQRVIMREWDVSFQGTSNTAAPILVEVVRQTSAGTGLNTAAIVKNNNSDQETIQSTGIYGILTTVNTGEPTDASVVPFAEFVHPQQGYAWRATVGSETNCQGGTRLGLRVTAAASVNANARLVSEE